MQKKKILIILGHPNKNANCGSFADAYEAGAKEGGHEVKRINIGDLAFDPILHKGYLEIQQLEPDLVTAQEDIKWADHLVIIHPIWWGGMPAIFRGFFERIWVPHFAYVFRKEGFFKGILWDKLLKAKTARIIIAMDNWPLFAQIQFGDTTHELKRCVLGFAGIRARVTSIGGMKFMSDVKKETWRTKLHAIGKKGK